MSTTCHHLQAHLNLPLLWTVNNGKVSSVEKRWYLCHRLWLLCAVCLTRSLASSCIQAPYCGKYSLCNKLQRHSLHIIITHYAKFRKSRMEIFVTSWLIAICYLFFRKWHKLYWKICWLQAENTKIVETSATAKGKVHLESNQPKNLTSSLPPFLANIYFKKCFSIKCHTQTQAEKLSLKKASVVAI